MPCCCCCKFNEDLDQLSKKDAERLRKLEDHHGVKRDPHPYTLPHNTHRVGKGVTVPVYLNVYNLIDTKYNTKLHKAGLALYHSGVEIGGLEYSFGEPADDTIETGLFVVQPMQAMNGFQHRLYLGKTVMTTEKLETILQRMKIEWKASRYEVLHRNCNHFCRFFCKRISTIEPLIVPPWVNRIANAGDVVVPRCAARWAIRKLDPNAAPPKSTTKEEDAEKKKKEKEKKERETREREAKELAERRRKMEQAAIASAPSGTSSSLPPNPGLSEKKPLAAASTNVPKPGTVGGAPVVMPNFNAGREPPKKSVEEESSKAPNVVLVEAELSDISEMSNVDVDAAHKQDVEFTAPGAITSPQRILKQLPSTPEKADDPSTAETTPAHTPSKTEPSNPVAPRSHSAGSSTVTPPAVPRHQFHHSNSDSAVVISTGTFDRLQEEDGGAKKGQDATSRSATATPPIVINMTPRLEDPASSTFPDVSASSSAAVTPTIPTFPSSSPLPSRYTDPMAGQVLGPTSGQGQPEAGQVIEPTEEGRQPTMMVPMALDGDDAPKLSLPTVSNPTSGHSSVHSSARKYQVAEGDELDAEEGHHPVVPKTTAALPATNPDSDNESDDSNYSPREGKISHADVDLELALHHRASESLEEATPEESIAS